MKKNATTTLLGMALAVSAFAAPSPTSGMKPTLPARIDIKEARSMAAGRHASTRSDEMLVTDVITSVSGKDVYMHKACAGYFLNWSWELESYSASDFASKIVYGENDDVYFYNIMSNELTGSYVMGFIDGNTIEVPLPQTTAFFEEDGYGLNLCVLNLEPVPGDEDGMYTYVVDEDRESVFFHIGEDGTITLEDMGDSILGYAYTDWVEWVGIGDSKQVYSPVAEEVTALPQGIDLERYSFITGDMGYDVYVGVSGDDLYIRDITPAMPGSVIKAAIHGDTASVAQDQILGIYSDTYFVYTKCAEYKADEYMLLDDDVTYDLRIDSENKTIKAVDPEMRLLLNASKDEVSLLQVIQDLYMFVQTDMDGTPRTPYNVYYINYDFLGWSNMYFNYSNLAADADKILDLDDMYYRVFYDEELMEFTLDGGYNDVPEGEVWTEIPLYLRATNFYFFGGQIILTFFSEGFDSVSAQLVYKHDGKVTYSDFGRYDLTTGEYSVVKAGPDGGYPTTYVKDVNSMEKVSATEYYDLNGCKVSNPAHGVFVRKQILEDGTVRTSKVTKR